jgi:glucose-fructose oxidoreductase
MKTPSPLLGRKKSSTPRHSILAAFPGISRRAFGGGVGAVALATATSGRGQSARPDGKLGIALVGLGSYSTDELGPALRETQFCRLAGVVTGSPEKGQKWAHDFDFPERNIFSYDTMAQLKNSPDIDIVYVVTPNALHARYAIAAAQAGKHVISEKPFTTSVADAEAVIAACRATNVKLSIGYRLHFDRYYRELIRLAREKDFGDFALGRGDLAFNWNRNMPGAWRLDKLLCGGWPMMDLGIYIIQAACMMAGEVAPASVTAQEGPTTRPDLFIDIEESMTWTMTFTNGFVCNCTASANYASQRSDFHNEFRAEAPQGWIELKNAFAYRNITGLTSRGPLNYGPSVRQQVLQMDDFARCVLEDHPSRVPGEMGLRDMKIIAAIYEAARTGGRVQLRV